MDDFPSISAHFPVAKAKNASAWEQVVSSSALKLQAGRQGAHRRAVESHQYVLENPQFENHRFSHIYHINMR
jgi:hypothetical protein